MLRAATVSLALTALVGGCGLTPVEPDAGPPGDDARVGGADAEPPASVLQFVFTSDPKVPGDLGGRESATVDTLEIELEDIRAISDNASPTLPELELEWGDGYNEDEVSLYFDDAPPGIYSRLRAQIEEISITGTVEVEDQDYDYIINGEAQNASIAVDLTAVSLSGTSTTKVEIAVAIRDAIRDLDWTALQALAVDQTIVMPDDLFDEFAATVADAFEQKD